MLTYSGILLREWDGCIAIDESLNEPTVSRSQNPTLMLSNLQSKTGTIDDDGLSSLIKDNCFVSVQQNPALSKILHCLSQDIALDVTSGMSQLLGTQGVVHANNILLDDGALVKIARDKVRRGPDELHAAVIGLVVGLGALEGRQKTVVDIDDFPRHGLAQRRRQNLHVPRQHDQLDLILLDELQDPGFLLLLCIRCHGEVHERHLVRCGELGELRVVRDDQRDLNGQLAS